MRTTLKKITAVLITLMMLLDLPISTVSALAEVIGVSDAIIATVITPVSPDTAAYVVHVGETVTTSSFSGEIDADTLSSNPSGIVSLAKAGTGTQSRRRINITGLAVGQTTASFEYVNSNTKNTVDIATYLKATFASTGLTSVVVNTDTAGQVEMPVASAIGFTRSGYALTGWSKSTNGSNPIALGAVETLTADTTYYAVWEQAYTVSYNANNGSGTIAAQPVKQGDSLVLSDGTGFTRTNYTLTGWATTSGGSKAYDLGATITPASNMTLYAVWVRQRTVSYSNNGGNGSIPSEIVLSGVDFTLSDGAAFTRSGYVLVGWSNNNGSSNTKNYELGGTTSVTADKTFYAVWARQRTVSYNSNGGTGAIAAQTVVSGQNFILSDGVGFSRTNYKQTGWSLNANGSNPIALGGTETVTADTTFYAVWGLLPAATFKRLSGNDIVTYTDANGVFSKPSAADVALTGHTFKFWTVTAPASGNGHRFPEGSDPGSWPAEFTASTISDNTVFYPVYTAEQHTVTFYVKDATGAEVIAGQSTAMHGDPVTAPAAGDVPEQNLVFTGWDRSFNSVTEDFDVHAVYRSASAKHIKFVAFNGTIQDVYKEVGETVQVPARTVPTAPGYYYYNWNTKQNNSGTTYQPGETFTVSKDLTVYELAGYVITFNANFTGANPMTATRHTDPDGFIVLPGDDIGFTRANYLLASWSTHSTPPSGETRDMLALGEIIQFTVPTTLYAYWNEVTRTFNHIDVRISGELYIENKIDNVVQSREKVTMSILGAQAKYGSSTTPWSTNVQNGVEIRFTNLNLTINTDITIIADVQYVLGGTTYTERLTLPMSYQDKLAAAAECPNFNNSSGGFDFILRPGRLTQTFSHSVTFYDYANHVVRQETGILDGHAATVTVPTADDVLVPPTTTVNGVETSYVFNGWEPRGSYGLGNLSNVTQDMIFDAKYTEVIRRLTRTLTVNKSWQNVPDGVAPPSVSFRVYKGLPGGGGQIIWETTPHATGELNAANSWTEVLALLPISNEAGSAEYAYKVEEDVPAGFTRQNASSIVDGDTYNLVNSQNKYTVTYNKGASGNLAGQDGSGNVVFANRVYGSTTPTAPVVTANAGYTFTGWNPVPSATVTGDATYTAQYQINVHTVTYMIGDTVYNTEANVPFGASKTVLGAPSAGSVPTGFTFAGWTPPIGLTVTGGSYTMPDNDVTFVANLTRNTYTVTYLVDGIQDGDIDGHFYGDDVTVRPEPTKTGFTFSGWQYPGSISVSGGIFDMPAQNVVITGTFTPITYTLQYMYVDLSGNPIPADQLPGDIAPAQNGTETYTLINKATVDNLPTLTEWLVSGWYRNAQFTGAMVDPGSEFAETPAGLLTTLYARLIKVNASLDVDKSVTSDAPLGGYKLGDTISYKVVVENNGNVTLTDVLLTDALLTPAPPAETLEPGQKKEYTYTHVVTDDDIQSNFLKNVATATGKYGDETVTDDDDKTVWLEKADPKLEVIKEVIDERDEYNLGDVIGYRVTVTNTGNVTIANITLTDAFLPGSPVNIGTLTPGQSSTVYEYTYTVTEADILSIHHKVKNTAAASGTYRDNPISDSDKKDVDVKRPSPSLDLKKKVTSTPANQTGYALGEDVVYELTVKNTGNVTLKNITIADAMMNPSSTVIPELAPNASQVFIYSHEVTEANIIAGFVYNAAVGWTWYGFKLISDNDDERVNTEPKNPKLLVEKMITSTMPDGGYGLGDTISYSVRVTNNGNLTILNIKLSDALMPPTPNILSLAPGEYRDYTYSHGVTEADILNGEVLNTFTAKGKYLLIHDVSAEDSADAATEPVNRSLDVVKTVTSPTPAGGYGLGHVISYSVTVTNTGNQTLTNITVHDPLMGPDVIIASLAPGESYAAIPYTHTITAEDVAAGEVINVVTVTTEDEIEDRSTTTTLITNAIDVTGTVEWFYGSAMSPESPKPTEVQVQLLANGSPYGPAVTVTGIGTTWTHTWPGLLETDAEGDPIVYSIKQLDVLTGYNTGNINNLTVLNSLKYFTVLFIDFDGTVLKSISVSYGGSTTPPADPERTGYSFIGWTGGVWVNVTANQIIIANYDLIPGATVITELGIPLAGGTVANVGDTFD